MSSTLQGRRSCPKRDQLLMRVGAAKTEAGRAFGYVKIQLPEARQAVTRQTFTFQLDKVKLREANSFGAMETSAEKRHTCNTHTAIWSIHQLILG